MRLFPIVLLVALAVTSLLLPIRAAEPLPELSIALGAQNTGAGLSVPSGGDGANVAETVAGVPVRRMAGTGAAQYLYVVVNHPAYSGPRDLWVTVEAANDVFARVGLQYDKDSPDPNVGTKYTAAGETMLLTGEGGWRQGVFFLPAARLGHGQNLGADFRLTGSGVAVQRITVAAQRPAHYDPDQPFDPAALAALRVARPAGMEFTLGNDASRADAALFAALSVTSVESYVDWAGVEPQEGHWDWSKWDNQVAILKAAKLKWVPFLLVGPAYATPLWFQNGPGSQPYRCLEHGRDSKVQSLFNPALRPAVARFVQAFAARYCDAGVLESVLLGVTGIYGESIYPAGPEGGWTARLTGDYHNHAGWWAGDRYAVAAFRAAMQQKYGDIAALNRAWGTHCENFEAVTPFVPDQAPSDRARADFVEWYQDAMTEWVAFWVKTAHQAMPQTEIYLCTGGNGDPMLGADFTAQAKAIAPFGAGIRITNEGSDYVANFTVTREVATATRLYGTFCGIEPASEVRPAGIVGRVYNATASGARQLHEYTSNAVGNIEAIKTYRANLPQLTPRRPRVEAALYVPRETWAFDPGQIGHTHSLARSLRDLVDIDFVTRRSVADGALRSHRLLVLSDAPVLEPEAATAIETWVRSGGVLVAATRPGETLGGRLHDNAAWRARVLAEATSTTGLLAPEVTEAPSRWVLDVGGANDATWLFGDWFDRERGGEWPTVRGATKRWTGAHPGVYLPVQPGAAYRLHLEVYVPGYAVEKQFGEVRINGQTVGRLDKSGLQSLLFKVPAALLGRASLARLELLVNAWKPSDHGSADARSLGVALHQIEWESADAEKTAPGVATLRWQFDTVRLQPLVRTVGQGRTIFLPGLANDGVAFAQALELLLRDTPRYLPGVPVLAPQDGRLDSRYATVTETGVLWLNGGNIKSD